LFRYIFQDDIIACEPPQFQACVGVYGQAYHHLVECLLKKSMHPLSNEDWTSDEKEVFRCYRTDVADTIMYCHNILRDDLLKLLNHHLEEAVKMCREPSGHARNWPYLETCLFSWSAIGEVLAEEEENQYMVQFLAKLPTIPFHGQNAVVSATLDCVGGFAEWLSSYPNLVSSLVPIITSAIGEPDLSLAATMALKDLARDCTDALQPCSRDIVQACAQSLASGRLKQGECVRLMYPLGKMFGFLPPEDMNRELQGVLQPYINELQTMASRAQPGPQDRGQTLYALKVLFTLFQSLDGSGGGGRSATEAQQGQRVSCLSVLLPQIFPHAAGAARLWHADEEVMDAVYMFLRQTLVCLQGTKQLVPEIVDFLEKSFMAHPHSTAIDLIRQLLLLHASDQQVKPALARVTAVMAKRTLEHVQAAANPSECSDLIATAFQGFSQSLKKHVDLFTGQPGQQDLVDASALLQCACFCLQLPEDGAAKYSASFICNLVSSGGTRQDLAQVVTNAGPSIVRSAITAAFKGAALGNSEEYASDVLACLAKHRVAEYGQWLEQGLVSPTDVPHPLIPVEVKMDLVKTLLRERSNKRKVNVAIKEFTAECKCRAGKPGNAT